MPFLSILQWWKISRKHLFQNRSARNCTCLHFLWWNWSALPNEPGDKQVVFFCIMKWKGVIGWGSCGPSELALSAHPFISRSTSVSNVCKTISVTVWITVRDFRTIARSSRRLKTTFAPSLKLFTLNVMLVPLFGTFSQLSFTTHKIGTSVTPQLDHLAAKIYESSKTHTIIKFIEWTNSRWIACVFRHMNKQHQRFTVLPPSLTYKRLKRSFPDKESGGW